SGDRFRDFERAAVDRLEVAFAADHAQLLSVRVVRQRLDDVRPRVDEIAVELRDDFRVLEHDLGDESAGLQVAAPLEPEDIACGADHRAFVEAVEEGGSRRRRRGHGVLGGIYGPTTISRLAGPAKRERVSRAAMRALFGRERRAPAVAPDRAFDDRTLAHVTLRAIGREELAVAASFSVAALILVLHLALGRLGGHRCAAAGGTCRDDESGEPHAADDGRAPARVDRLSHSIHHTRKYSVLLSLALRPKPS